MGKSEYHSTKPEKVAATIPGIVGFIRQALKGQWDKCGNTVYHLEMVTRATTKKGLEDRTSRLNFAAKL